MAPMVDLHTHIWDAASHLDEGFHRAIGASFAATPTGVARDARGPRVPDASPRVHAAANAAAERVVVLAFDMLLAGAVVPNEYVAAYVASNPGRLVGFASVDPTRPDALERLQHAHQGLRLRGLKLSAAYQGVHPEDPRMAPLYRYCEQHGLPILVHQGATILPQTPLALGNPQLLDSVAQRHPDLRIVVAHVGFPWATDTVVLMRKHPHVYADLSALSYRPWQLFDTLQKAWEARVTEKLFFGSDWPFATFEQSVAGLRSVVNIGRAIGLHGVGDALVDDILERDPFPALGLFCA
jgi:predicted TIM-barrel fold metal-dependent hydrolase